VRDANGALTVEEGVAAGDPRVVVHDAHTDNPTYAFALSRLQSQDSRYAPMGVFRSVQRPTYDALMADQLERAATKAQDTGLGNDGEALDRLLRGADTWSIA
jgi:2-oxoglutarate ferredoxin oxidoreductase subunit beta